jgi:hypothetical protein
MRRKARTKKSLVKRLVRHIKRRLQATFVQRAKLKTKFRLVRERFTRKTTQALILGLRQLKALHERSSRKRRRGLRTVRLHRQWRSRAIRRRFRRHQKRDILTRRQF